MQLFAEKGFAQTTVLEIAERTGIAKSTVFNYFPSKEAILAQCGKFHLEFVQNLIQELEASDLDTKSKIIKILEAEIDEVERTRHFVHIVLTETYKSDWAYSLEAHNRMQLADLYAGVLRAGQAKGEVNHKADCQLSADMIVALYFHALYTWTVQDPSLSVKDYVKRSLDMLWQGIGVLPK